MDPHIQERFVARLVNERVLERIEALELAAGLKKKPEDKKPATAEAAKEPTK